ncbi:uromodulin [Lingula anatina]|uniref:Uromodulin n=1 Tax=Lingula anatina TaxID=7574 RepID=A0A1S3K8A1_LINAN|nr:uromodulin [Lingula anatina]|eukprot:XP_013418853.1 uromodulin [Lingula anatina]
MSPKFGALLVVLLATLSSVSSEPEKNCSYYGEYLRDASDRCYFYQCESDLTPIRQRCAPGTTVKDDFVATENDANPCQGPNLPCTSDGTWSDWSDWGECSVTCGSGVQKSTRDCLPAGATCDGDAVRTQECRRVTCDCFSLSYVVLDQQWRSLNFTRFDGGEPKHCDRDGWASQWYRFSGAAGTKMPNWCVPDFQCGTDAPVWINGADPAPEDGAVDRQACAHWTGNCCRWSMNVQVLNCEEYFLYYLPPTTVCSLVYCGED